MTVNWGFMTMTQAASVHTHRYWLLPAIAVLFLLSGCVIPRTIRHDANPIGTPPEEVLAVMKRVADWQLANPSRHGAHEWPHGAWYAGLMALANTSQDTKYLDAMLEIGSRAGWAPGPRPYMADDHAVLQAYLEMYLLQERPVMLEPARRAFDQVIANPVSGRFDVPVGDPGWDDQWTWCDALFMAPPVLARLYAATGDAKYLDFMDREWWTTYAALWDDEAGLFYRDKRFIGRRTPNGQKVFWSRGNGWVFGGIVRVLQYLPDDHPSRSRYIALFRRMADTLVAIQGADGLWRPSLLDPQQVDIPETSGSAFFTYGLAWGINSGLLDRETYLPAVQRSWSALVGKVDAAGRLTHVQQIGDAPEALRPEQTEVYGSGAFLLAGSEVYRLALLGGARETRLRATNPASELRLVETVEAPLEPLLRVLGEPDDDSLLVIDSRTGQFVPHQIVRIRDEDPLLVFQGNFTPREEKTYRVVALAGPSPVAYPTLAYARFVPERYDDFAWENDRVAFRVYGPALEAPGNPEQLSSSGIDLWAKNFRYPVIDRWYAHGDYHTDHGEGLDFYSVSTSRGCGGLAIWGGDEYHGSGNFQSWELLAAGPERTVFELTYAPWSAGPCRISEFMRITLDVGRNLNRIDTHLRHECAGPVIVGLGIGNMTFGLHLQDPKAGVMSYWSERTDNGVLACGVVYDPELAADAAYAGPFGDSYYSPVVLPADGRLTYWAGGAWSGNGDFADMQAWHGHLNEFARLLNAPIKVLLPR